jgi:hypothetical protein
VKIQSFIAFGLAVVLTVSAQTSRQNEVVKSGKTLKAQGGGGDWVVQDKKTASVEAVLEYVFANHKEGNKCVGKGSDSAFALADENTKTLFKDHGNNMEIPADSRAIIFDEDEWDRGAGRSVILAVPPPDSDLQDKDKLLNYALNYVHWAPQSSVQIPRGPNGETPPWYDPEKKRQAILQVLKQMVRYPRQAEALIGNDAAARKFFNQYGGIGDVPIEYGARVIVFPTTELGKAYKGHVWLYLPRERLMYWGNWPDRPTRTNDPGAREPRR